MPEFKLDPIENWDLGSAPACEPLSQWNSPEIGERLATWFEVLLQFQTASLTRNDFYQSAAEAMVQLTNLDSGWVILQRKKQWETVASCLKSDSSDPSFDSQLLVKVAQERATFFSPGNPQEKVPGYIASPIFDKTGAVAGVFFGQQSIALSGNQAIQKIDALSLQLLGGIVSSGLARQANQEDADRFRMQLEQFASAKLVSAMSEDPTFLDSKERMISVLFGDVRGFTGLAQRVGPEKTFSMIRNLMDQLTGSILDEEGFIIDYAGDGIAAMWNAPADQPDHAELACWAAINMQKVMNKLSEFWSFVAGESLTAGIGINTGIAHVGNSGSRWRLKYSPLGASVNLASRLEGANKFFGSSILVAEETKERMFSSFPLRRIGPVIVKGASEPVEVFQLLTSPELDATHEELKESYDRALNAFLQNDFHTAESLLKSLLADQDDQISQRLLEQTQKCLLSDDPISAIRLTSK